MSSQTAATQLESFPPYGEELTIPTFPTRDEIIAAFLSATFGQELTAEESRKQAITANWKINDLQLSQIVYRQEIDSLRSSLEVANNALETQINHLDHISDLQLDYVRDLEDKKYYIRELERENWELRQLAMTDLAKEDRTSMTELENRSDDLPFAFRCNDELDDMLTV